MAGETVNNVRLIDFEEIVPGQIFRAYAGKLTDGEVVIGDDAEQRTGNAFIDIATGNVYFYDEDAEDWILPGATEAAGGES